MRPSWLTIGLGLSMTVSYGVLYYSFAKLAPLVAREHHWDLRLVFGIFSVSLLAGAIAAPMSGRLIDRFGARLVMGSGSLLASLALVGFSQSHSYWQFGFAVLLAEIVAVSVQYEAAFTALAKRHGMQAGRHITGVTLIAGFSSTIFWPLIEFLLSVTDWRHVYLILAALNLVICLPIHLSVPGGSVKSKESAKPDQSRPVERTALLGPDADGRKRAMILMGIVFTGGGFVMSAINSSIMVLLADMGFGSDIATWSVALIGPTQVLARIGDLWLSPRLPATGVATLSALLMASALLPLMAATFTPIVILLAIFAVIYGAGQGLNSIVKGVLPLDFFGSAHYGRITGTLAGYRLAISAAAPLIVISLRESGGAILAISGLMLAAMISVGAVFLLAIMDPSRTRKNPVGL